MLVADLGLRCAPPQALRFRPLRGLRQIQLMMSLIRDSFSLSCRGDKLKFVEQIRDRLTCSVLLRAV